MSTVIPTRELGPLLDQLDRLGLNDLDAFVASTRASVEQRCGIVLDNEGSARVRFRADAQQLNGLTDQPRALGAWLEEAALQLGTDAPRLAEEVQRKYFVPGRTPVVGALEIPERIILRDDMVEFVWLMRAVEAARSIAWLSVPRYFDGAKVAGEAMGTGLLLDPCHVLTCLHVLQAREPGEAKPKAEDLERQVKAARVAFGYLSGPRPSVTMGVPGLTAFNQSLDYAVIELETAVDHPVPPLFLGELPSVSADATFLVNILQHPGGGAKRLAMRNNAVARIDDERIAYWTDTDYGSSGAPVFDDEWRVIALHRAYEERSGLQYLGRSVGGANIGSRMTKIVEDLRTAAPQLVPTLRLGT
ncbi:trypsin-like serine peptidase [Paraliomyxa miuraensis]|uniref:trypsin-like serine peptidase n=1 Tax=Paraliomyxa miuraensis TaxID=376150 RepID=UPI002252FFC9|nr:serine protease [Paraliomyxa miuraensis]MCX4239756.1 serine protease [Paraliomyxa miuraensis]